MQKIINYFFDKPRFFLIFRNKLQNNLASEKAVIRKYAKLYKNSKVLDFGCGTGDFCLLFDKFQYVGVDIDEKFIEFAKSRFKGYIFQRINEADPLPFEDGYFDIILVFGVLHHISGHYIHEVLNELDRVLSSRGQIILYDQLPSREQGNFFAKILVKFDKGEFIRKGRDLKIILKKHFKIEENFNILSGPYSLCVFVLKKLKNHGQIDRHNKIFK
jgi:ubiquinone/menaquinone biosynthesis C-methylase UbiE